MSPAAEESHFTVALHHTVDDGKAGFTSGHWRVVFERVTIASNDFVKLVEGVVALVLRDIAVVENVGIPREDISKVPKFFEVDMCRVAKDVMRLVDFCRT